MGRNYILTLSAGLALNCLHYLSVKVVSSGFQSGATVQP